MMVWCEGATSSASREYSDFYSRSPAFQPRQRNRAPASKSEYLLEVVDAQAAFPASGLERERVMLLTQNS